MKKKNTPLVFNISSPYLQLSLSFNKKRYKLLFTLWCGEHSKYCLYKMIEAVKIQSMLDMDEIRTCENIDNNTSC